MKELSIEEKAKRYDEALGKARRYYDEYKTRDNILYVEDMEDMFPELKESEDERIRKWIIGVLSTYEHDRDLRNAAIAYLEKQGEQKPVGKVESNFKVGDWVCHNVYKKPLQIVEDLGGGDYRVEPKSIINAKELKEGIFRYWTIQDAKDGDVLEYQGEIFIIRELKKKVIASRTIEYYCCYDGEHFINNSIYSLMDDDLVNIHPSTHEQHNLLLQKMHEAGYEWDAEKKELKKIEQRMVSAEAKEAMYSKPVEWSEKDEYNYNTILHHLDLRKEKYKKECNQEEQDRYQGLYDWLKSIRPQNMWKPSEEQMKALEWQVNNTSEGSWQYEESKNLLEQLKKLKG